MAYRIAVMGTGYVGLITAVGLADFGNQVVGVDLDDDKVERLNRGQPTIFEHGLQEYLARNLGSGRLRFSRDACSAIREADLVLLSVGTPSLPDGDTDLSQIHEAVELVGQNLNGYKVIVTKSTVPVGTNRWIRERLQQTAGHSDFGVLANPEFLREGRAIQDFFHPDRIVVGFDDEKARQYARALYRPLYLIKTPFVWCSLETAELMKLASNAFLALKISFINQMANLSEAVGADIHTIAHGMGMDRRISPKFLHPGPGFGGSCFPKDVRALVQAGRKVGIDLSLVREIDDVNRKQKERVVEKLARLTPLKGKVIAVLGLAFKSETDDIRESPSLAVVTRLLAEGALVHAHDPKAIANFQKAFPRITYHGSPYEAAQGAEAVVIMTEWNEYRNIDLHRLKSVMKGTVLLDTRNLLEPASAREAGFTYQGTGR